MPKPGRVFRADARTAHGALKSHDLALIAKRLTSGGAVLVPSDTCYSLAMIPHNEHTRARVNTILNRPPQWPVSLAFPGIRAVRDVAALSVRALHLLETFTPGPLTLVCPVTTRFAEQGFATRAVGSTDLTVGVRIPDSHVERDIAGCTSFPVTSTALRTADGEVVRSFDDAVAMLTATGLPEWDAVEGDGGFRSRHSTVVRLTGSGLELLREGDLPFADLRAALDEMPQDY
ncbi:L-threonylcarbamoyladenylate synthase [Labedaea rhizosphaerae]|uniref:L-threonylcarbamoyladenylate synthase n=1 Tax=Labedaea rhizosphaerae TaxID=598644 RepID=A0A4R6SEA7_LABRH|nr:Sua5/YciO/YrdC/YwlC family protein [Labedaea rhizosphaerae]TDP97983.1 L-threonylcarbamoyladenylate synthase [Labedaea rhizosphaerae]